MRRSSSVLLAGLLTLTIVSEAAAAKPGTPAKPEVFTLKSYSNLVKLHGKERVWPARLLGPKKAVVLSFLASWCRPCIEELPEVVALSKQSDVDVWLVVLADERKEGDKTCRLPESIRELIPTDHPLADKTLVDECGNFAQVLTGSDKADLPLNVLFGPASSGPARSLKVLRGKQATKDVATRLEPELSRALAR